MIVTHAVIQVDPTTDIQGAINALPQTGGELLFAPGTYMISDMLTVSKPLIMRGAGIGVAQNDATKYATTIVMNPAVTNKDMLLISSRNVLIEDLTLYGAGSGTGCGVVIGHNYPTYQFKIALRRVCIKQTGAECVHFEDVAALETVAIILSEFEDCWFLENQGGTSPRSDYSHVGAVYVGAGHTTITFKNCSVSRFKGGDAVRFSDAYGCSWTGGSIEEPLDEPGVPGEGQPFFVIRNCVNTRLENVWFENTTTFQGNNTYPIALIGSCWNTHIKDCNVQYGAANVNVNNNPRCISLGSDSGFVRGTTIENLLATIAYGTLAPYNHVVVGDNCSDTVIIGGGITDNTEQLVASCTVGGDLVTLTRASGSFATDGIQVGAEIYPVIAGTGRIPNGTYVSAVGTTTLTMAHRDSAVCTAGAITGNVIFNPGGRPVELKVMDSSKMLPVSLREARRWRLPNVLAEHLATLILTRDVAAVVPTQGDMAWVADAVAGQKFKVYNGSEWQWAQHAAGDPVFYEDGFVMYDDELVTH